jgi:hypothetical protein
VLNEADSETEAKTSPVDPLDDTSARRCRVCGDVLARRSQRVHPGNCARAWKTLRQKSRRERSRGGGV